MSRAEAWGVPRANLTSRPIVVGCGYAEAVSHRTEGRKVSDGRLRFRVEGHDMCLIFAVSPITDKIPYAKREEVTKNNHGKEKIHAWI